MVAMITSRNPRWCALAIALALPVTALASPSPTAAEAANDAGDDAAGWLCFARLHRLIDETVPPATSLADRQEILYHLALDLGCSIMPPSARFVVPPSARP